MACTDYHELLSAHIDGELTEAEARRLQEHLARCEDCRVELARLQCVWNALDVMPEVEPSADLVERIYRQTAGRPSRVVRVLKWLTPLTAAAAAVLVVTIIWPGRTTTTTPAADETQHIVRNLEMYQQMELLENLDMLEAMGDDFTALPALDVLSDSDKGTQS